MGYWDFDPDFVAPFDHCSAFDLLFPSDSDSDFDSKHHSDMGVGTLGFAPDIKLKQISVTLLSAPPGTMLQPVSKHQDPTATPSSLFATGEPLKNPPTSFTLEAIEQNDMDLPQIATSYAHTHYDHVQTKQSVPQEHPWQGPSQVSHISITHISSCKLIMRAVYSHQQCSFEHPTSSTPTFNQSIHRTIL